MMQSETIIIKHEGFGIFTKQLCGFIFVLVVTGLGDYYSFTQMNRLSDLTTKIFNHPLRVTRAVLSADTHIVKIHRSMKDVALSSTSTELQTAISSVNVDEKQVFEHLGIVEKWILGDEGAALLAETVELFQDWKPIRDEVITLTQAGNRTQAFAITKGKGAEHVDVLNRKMEELKNYAAIKASGMLSDSHETLEKIVEAILIIFLGLSLLCGLFGYLLSRMITDSIKQLVKGVVEFGRGNLDYEVKVKFKDEIGWLANAFNNMSAQRKIVDERLNLQSEIMTNMAEGVLLVSIETGLIVYANPKLEEMFGYVPGEMNGKHVSGVNAQTDKQPEETAAEIMNEINTSGEWHGEVQSIRKNGTQFWSYAKISIFEHFTYGKVAVSVQTDITRRKLLENELLGHRSHLEETIKKRTAELEKEIAEHKRTEYLLIEGGKRFRAAVTNAPYQIMIHAQGGEVLQLSKSWSDITGYRPEEIPTIYDWAKLAYGLNELDEEAIQVINKVYILRDRERQDDGVWPVIIKSGEIRYWDFSTTPLGKLADGRNYVITMAIDITDRKQVESKILKLAQIVESSIDAIVGVDLKGNVTTWNPSAEKLFGYSAREIIGTTVDKVAPDRLKGELGENVRKMVTEEVQINTETVRMRKDGTEFDVLLSAGPIIENEKVIGVSAILRDITARKQMEENLISAKQTAESANQAKSEFLANMSHELRTPLNAVLGFSQLLLRDGTLHSNQRENVNTIVRAGEHLLNLINDVLEMSKIEIGRMELRYQNFNLHSMLDTIKRMVGLRAENRGLRLTMSISPQLPRIISTDEGKLRQVLMHLLRNAIKFTEEGSISIRVSCSDHEISDFDQKTELYFEIEDTGIGIAPEEANLLFNPFQQSKLERGIIEGTGLGLAISQKYVGLMGGEIIVKSDLDKGSVFSFSIQTEKISSAETENDKPYKNVIGLKPNPLKQHSWRILVVDDNPQHRTLLKELLNVVGFDVQDAINGEDAVEKNLLWHPHLILMDIRMPVMNGYDAARKIKSDPEGKNTVIFALTADALQEERGKMISAGCDDFVSKPIQIAEIFEKMAKYLGISYEYASSNSKTGDIKTRRVDEVLTPESLRIIPVEMLKELEQASARLKIKDVTRALEKIQSDFPVIAEPLARLAKDYKYQEIWDLIQKTKEDQNE